MNYNDTLSYIHSLGNYSMNAGLERIKKLMDFFGNPQNNFKSVHIAGTNGKGSVSAMLAKTFEIAGYKTGLFISPFIINFRERIQINGDFISEEDLCYYSEKVKAAKIAVTEFEFITAVAFLYFSERDCDIVIAETGLGGRFDATNVIKNPSAAVITRIGLDHTTVLGNTIEKIAAEKCGIIKECPVISSVNQDPNAFRVIKNSSAKLIVPDISALKVIKTDETGSAFLYESKEYRLSLCGEYQIENALTVIETIKNCGFNISHYIIYEALSNTHFPARMEIISKNPLVVLDGAHNPDGAKELSKYMERYSGKITAIIGVMRDKDYSAVLKTTLIHCKSAVAVTVNGMERSLKAEDLYDTAKKYCECIAARDYLSAIKKADKISAGDPIFIYGSLYFASVIRDLLLDFYK